MTSPLSDEERALIAAVMDRILPEDDGPGAKTADSMAYLDWLLAQPHFGRSVATLRKGAALLNDFAMAGQGKRFVDCSEPERDRVMDALQQVPHPAVQDFFVIVIRTTLAGFLCPPHYGGNRARAGWSYIGFSPHPEWLASHRPLP